MAHSGIAASLSGRIAADGPISFAEFMETALYHPDSGYYMRPRAAYSDYFTSVSVHPVFAEMLARHLDDVWDALGRPDPFNVVELGCGDGSLAERLLALAPEHPWGGACNYAGVEISPAFRASAAKVKGVVYVPDLRDLPACAAAAVIANELFDALPFAIARRSSAGWMEERVGLNGARFDFCDAPASPEILAYASEYARAVPDGGRIEIRRGVAPVYAAISALAPKAIITTIDYGGAADEIHNTRLRAGTALAFRGHRGFEDLLVNPGDRDLTAHVNFSELVDAGRKFGFEPAPLTRQADFLAALGIGDYLVHLQAQPGVSVERYAREREAVSQLVSPDRLGRFRVLVQARGAALNRLRGIPAPP